MAAPARLEDLLVDAVLDRLRPELTALRAELGGVKGCSGALPDPPHLGRSVLGDAS